MNDTMKHTEFDTLNINDLDAEELESLNIDDLDIEELENRLELAAATPEGGCYVRIGPESESGTSSE